MLRQFCACIILAICLNACDFPANRTPLETVTAVPLISEPAPITHSQPPTPSPQLETPEPQPPTPSPQPPAPTPTYDPKLPEWTLLVYMNADNNLEAAGLLDLNEMEAATQSKRVNVLVQIDRAIGETEVDGNWTDTRRYHIQSDDDVSVIGSDLVTELGELNMGDPLVLADFITWGAANYPANHYALILWDHGAGWNGIAFDGDTADYGDPDYLSLGDLDGALTKALSQTGVDKLDVIGFDACLMGQLDVFQAIAPFADFAVGSEELTPGKGWDYQVFLEQIADEPDISGERLAQAIAANFIDYYTRFEPDDFVTMTAVDLAKVGRVTTAVSHLAQTLSVSPAQAASAVGDARSGAEAFARVYAHEFDRYAAVDLHHFASILAQRSPDATVKVAANAVMEAVETAVIANEHGSGFKHSGGIAIYFPRQAQFYDATYAQTTSNAAWDRFLTSYHISTSDQLPPPELTLTSVRGEPAGAQNPAFLNFEIGGRQIEHVSLLGGRFEEDGRRRLLEFDRLIPEPTFLPDGSQLKEWRDGVHEDFFIWDTRVTYLYDADGGGDFVVMWPATVVDEQSGGERLFTVQGRFHRASETGSVDANLVFDHVTGQLIRVWGMQPGANLAPAEIVPQPGDEFQVFNLYLDEADQIVREPGSTINFDVDGQLFFDWWPLPSGEHYLGMAVENVAGDTAVSFTNLSVNNDIILSGLKTYLDPYWGFQFLYPDTWYTPTYKDSLLYTSDRNTMTDVQITLYPNLEKGVDAAALKAQTINLFGSVDILFEDEVVIVGRQALRTAYGYRSDDDFHTGVFLTFTHNGQGFVVDVDGRLEDEAATITAVDSIASSWQFIPAGAGLPPGQWAQLNLDTFSIAQPADFVYQEVGEWQRFSSDRNTFVALRTQPTTIETQNVMEAILRDAGSGVNDFAQELVAPVLLGDSTWERANFSYQNDDGRSIWGFIMVKVADGQEVVAWAEAPADTYNELEQTVFLVMVSDLALTK